MAGLCDDASSHTVDTTHPNYVFRGVEAVPFVFGNTGAPPIAGAIISDPADSVIDGRDPAYGATITINVPQNAAGQYDVGLIEGQGFSFWTDESFGEIAIPTYTPAVVIVPKQVPTISTWGIIIFVLAIGVTGTLVIRRTPRMAESF